MERERETNRTCEWTATEKHRLNSVASILQYLSLLLFGSSARFLDTFFLPFPPSFSSLFPSCWQWMRKGERRRKRKKGRGKIKRELHKEWPPKTCANEPLVSLDSFPYSISRWPFFSLSHLTLLSLSLCGIFFKCSKNFFNTKSRIILISIFVTENILKRK